MKVKTLKTIIKIVKKALMKPGLQKNHFEKKPKLIKACLMDHTTSFCQERQNRKDGEDEIFGKDVACSLRKIKDENLKEYTKLKIQ